MESFKNLSAKFFATISYCYLIGTGAPASRMRAHVRAGGRVLYVILYRDSISDCFNLINGSNFHRLYAKSPQ